MPQKITERNCAIVLLIMFMALSAWIMSIPYDPMSAVRMRGPPDEPTILTWSELYLQGKYSVPLEEFIEEKYPAPQSVVVERDGKYFVANEKGPGYCVLLAGFIFLGIESFVVVFLGAVTCISTYFLARRLFDYKVAFISTVLVVTCTDALLMLQRYGHPDYATMAFAVLGLWLFIESLHTFYGNSENKLLYATALGIAGGVALGFSVTTRYAVVFLLLVPFIYFSAVNYNLLRKSFASFIRSSKILLPYIAGILIPMLLLLNYNATVFGSPFESGYNFEQIITIHPEILNNTTSTRDPVGGWNPLNILENIVQLAPLFFIGMPAILFLPYALFKLRKGKSLALFASWFLSIFMFYMGIGWVGDDPFLIAHLRYFLPALPGICICAGYAISVLRNRSFAVCIVGMLVFVGVAGAGMQFKELEMMGEGPLGPPMQERYQLFTISQLLSSPLNFKESFVRVENANIISMKGVDGHVILNIMDNTSPRNLTVAVESASGLPPLSLNDTINVQGLFRQGITNPEEDVNGEWEIFIKAGTNDIVEKV